jgi:hypothetical protein
MPVDRSLRPPPLGERSTCARGLPRRWMETPNTEFPPKFAVLS